MINQNKQPLTLTQVLFKYMYRGVREVNCHHTEVLGNKTRLHFTVDIYWTIPTSYIQTIQSIKHPLS